MINEAFYNKIKDNWDHIAKPLDSLGRFEEVLSRMGAILEDESIDISKAALIVTIADNGIIKEGVSQSGTEVTLAVANALGAGKSSVCHMARESQIDVFPYDIGMVSVAENIEGRYKVACGTKNFASEPALTLDELEKAINNGRLIARDKKNQGYRVLLLGEMGIGNTTTSTAVIASILGLDAKEICGRGAGLDDIGLHNKTTIINRAIKKYELTPQTDAKTVLRIVGGLDIATMVGIILEAIELRIPVILDGVITAAAALVARRICKDAEDIVFFSHKGKEKGIKTVADIFNQVPIIDGALALGEGTGGVMFYGCLKTALSLYRGNTLFEDIQVEQYKRF